MAENVMPAANRAEFRGWLMNNARTERECWLKLRRGKPKDDGEFYYLDAVEEALCFGWIDSTLGIVNGIRLQRFSPRAKNSGWTELNRARARRLDALGLMTEAGRAVLPEAEYVPDAAVEADIKAAGVWELFRSFPPLYQRVRAYNLAAAAKRSPAEYEKALAHFVRQTRSGKMYGQWNDYGRLP